MTEQNLPDDPSHAGPGQSRQDQPPFGDLAQYGPPQGPPRHPGFPPAPGSQPPYAEQPGTGQPPYAGAPSAGQPPYVGRPDGGQPPYVGPPGAGRPPYWGQPGPGHPQGRQPGYPPQEQPPGYPTPHGQPLYPPPGPSYPPDPASPYPPGLPGQYPPGPPGQYGPGQFAPVHAAPMLYVQEQTAPVQHAQAQYQTGGLPGPWGPDSPQGVGQQWGATGPQSGPHVSPQLGRQPRGGGNRIIFLASGGLAVVAVIGMILALVFGGGDDEPPGPGPLPIGHPSPHATTGTDVGIDAGNGVFVKPALGFVRKTSTDAKGVYLVKQGEATFWLQVVKGRPGQSGADTLPRLMDSQKKSMTSGTFRTGEIKRSRPPAGQKSNVTLVTSQSWAGSVTNQSVTTQLVGYIAIIDTKNGVVSAVQVVARKEHAPQLTPEIEAMVQSVVKSQ
jgi:hypothetical protein